MILNKGNNFVKITIAVHSVFTNKYYSNVRFVAGSNFNTTTEVCSIQRSQNNYVINPTQYHNVIKLRVWQAGP